jgi:threonine dehydrogenase-like Zn-dependent dehydrogenase
MGSAHLSVDVPRLVELYLQGRLKLDELITERYSLGQINEAIASMGRGAAQCYSFLSNGKQHAAAGKSVALGRQMTRLRNP